jgi:hypothetical protein
MSGGIGGSSNIFTYAPVFVITMSGRTLETGTNPKVSPEGVSKELPFCALPCCWFLLNTLFIK